MAIEHKSVSRKLELPGVPDVLSQPKEIRLQQTLLAIPEGEVLKMRMSHRERGDSRSADVNERDRGRGDARDAGINDHRGNESVRSVKT